ncbi:MAG: 50S ribosomal protein L20, partial [Pseudomonadota bacterium]
MSRVKGGTVTHARHKKVVKAAKGYYGRRKNTFKVARQAVDKANQYATRDRKNRKRNFRALWIQRINAAVRAHDEALTYSRFINGLNLAVNFDAGKVQTIYEARVGQRLVMGA